MVSFTREETQQNPSVRALLGDLEEDPANKKEISVMFLALGDAARKQFMDKYPTTALWELKAQQLIALCNHCSSKKSAIRPSSIIFKAPTTWRIAISVLARVERTPGIVRLRGYNNQPCFVRTCEISLEEKRNLEVEQLFKEFPKLFKRKAA